jgi:predicted lipoprotein
MRAHPGTGMLAVLLTLGVAGPVAAESQHAQQQGTAPAGQATGAAQPGMQHLQQAAQQLREAMQAMAQQQPDQHRDVAMKEAEDALLHAQEAMAQAAAIGQGGGKTR